MTIVTEAAIPEETVMIQTPVDSVDESSEGGVGIDVRSSLKLLKMKTRTMKPLIFSHDDDDGGGGGGVDDDEVGHERENENTSPPSAVSCNPHATDGIVESRPHVRTGPETKTETISGKSSQTGRQQQLKAGPAKQNKCDRVTAHILYMVYSTCNFVLDGSMNRML